MCRLAYENQKLLRLPVIRRVRYSWEPREFDRTCESILFGLFGG